MGVASQSSTIGEDELLAAARGGDEEAFRRIVEPHRAELHAHCYRMLGSLHDAEDALQNVMLRAWRGLRRFEGRSATRAWLYKIATNVCLDAIGKRPKRVLPIDYAPPARTGDDPGEPLSESVWVEPYPDERLGLEDGHAAPEARYEQREAVELAFIAALQHLPPRQRAALILREVLGFSAREVAAALDTTVASVNSALQRARKAVDERLPEQSQQATMRSLGDERLRRVEDFIDAFERGDVDAILNLLAEDATFTMPRMRAGIADARRSRTCAHARWPVAPPALRADARERPARPRHVPARPRRRRLRPDRPRRSHPRRLTDRRRDRLPHSRGLSLLRAPGHASALSGPGVARSARA